MIANLGWRSGAATERHSKEPSRTQSRTESGAKVWPRMRRSGVSLRSRVTAIRSGSPTMSSIPTHVAAKQSATVEVEHDAYPPIPPPTYAAATVAVIL